MFGLNKKGLIFTVDAIIALGIFLTALFMFYSFFLSDANTPFGLSGAGIYTKTDNYLYVEKIFESYSSVFNLYQKGDTTGADQLFELIRSQSGYPANMRMYVLNGSTLEKIYDVSPNDFTEKFVFRTYNVYTITRNMPHQGTDVFVNAPSTLANKTTNVSVSIYNPGGPLYNVNVQLQVYNYTNDLMSWTISPVSQTIGTISSGVNETVNFTVSVPEDAWVDEYYSKAIVSVILQNGTDPFNVVRYGLVEMEVGI